MMNNDEDGEIDYAIEMVEWMKPTLTKLMGRMVRMESMKQWIKLIMYKEVGLDFQLLEEFSQGGGEMSEILNINTFNSF